MPMTCVAYGCNNHFVRGCGKQFFRFPMKDPQRLSMWVTAIRRKNWKPSASSRICSDHFTDKDYMLRPGAMVPRLRLDAAPSVFSGFPKHLKDRLERKKSKKTEEQVVVICNHMETQNEDKPFCDKEELKKTSSSCENSESTTDKISSLSETAIPWMDTAGNPEEQPTVVTHPKITKMKNCVVHGCSNTHFKGCKKQFFRFPLNDPERLSMWIVAVQRKYWKPSTSSTICSDHFTDKDYMLYPEATDPQLRHDAVPSIFIKNPKWKNIPSDGTEVHNKDQVNLDPVEKSLPPTCVVYGCNNTFVKGCRKQFFRFPMKNPQLLCKWIQAVRTTQWKPSASSRICSDHFKNKDYILQPGMKVPRLHANAVPFVYKEKRCRRNNDNTAFASLEQLTETHRPADHTYSALLNAVDIPCYKPDTIKLKKKVRTLQRQIQRQRHTIKKLSERLAQLRKNKDLCSISLLVPC
ncbi:PREDICTED: uncharacterized protein LOC108789487 [Nanorana parkeri]|uniref:uncharacterized protein LOC108789487 n=1 Tax=Nanorana parkeri TaxID=125878 RepID=UPI0008546E06|nr:PREDICTED: uncharacterized protein LOC108789487 [Nanorana parkeri]